MKKPTSGRKKPLFGRAIRYAMLPCSKGCGNKVERVIGTRNPTCYSCKIKGMKERYKKHGGKQSKHKS